MPTIFFLLSLDFFPAFTVLSSGNLAANFKVGKDITLELCVLRVVRLAVNFVSFDN